MAAEKHLNIIQPQVTQVMREKVARVLDQIEWEHNCEIIFACESGSRAWGFASPDSDYDVRFIYRCNPEDYIQIGKRRDVIERPINHSLDVCGWDINKALGLLRKSNPSLLEWLNSPIIYKQNASALKVLHPLVASSLNTEGLFWHYFSMAKNNYNRVFHRSNKSMMKRYLYVLRPLLCAKWVTRYKSMPPVVFDEVVLATIKNINVLNEIEALLQAKSQSAENAFFEPTIRLNQMIETLFKTLEKNAPKKQSVPDSKLYNTVLNTLVFDMTI